jgi:hypothetical protein
VAKQAKRAGIMATHSGVGRGPGKRVSERRGRGFRAAAEAARPLLGGAGARRGFAERKLIEEWRDIVGAALAESCRPVKMSFRRGDGAFGATLIVEAEGARALEAQHLSERIVERVNQVYGYCAVSRLKVVQTAPGASGPGGVAEPQAGYAPPPPVDPHPSPLICAVEDDGLRAALARLEANIARRPRRRLQEPT